MATTRRSSTAALRALIAALLLGAGLSVAAGSPPAGAALSDGFAQVDVGYHHTCGITTVDELFCWGTGNEGQLGNGIEGPLTQAVPLLIPPPSGRTWASVSTGEYHTCALATSGEGYCWGIDQWGQLGNGPALADPIQPTITPIAAPGGVSWKQISAGSRHTCAVTTAGAAYCWGSDAKGQLGNGPGTTADQASPSLVSAPGGVTWASIDAGAPDSNNFGGQQTCAVTTTGAAYCWGDDSEGQLGNGPGTTADQASPSLVSTPGGVTWARVRVGLKHACGVSTAGVAYCWGANQASQLGLGASPPALNPAPVAVVTPGGTSWSDVTPGSFSTCGRTTAGAAYCWGSEGAAGELGNGAAITGVQSTPSLVEKPAEVASWATVTSGYQHGCAIAADASAWCWGSDTWGKLGNGTTLTGNQPAPTLVGTGGVVVTPPGAPTITVATAGDAQVSLTWMAPPSNGGSAITGYVVTPFIGANAQPDITFNSTALSQVISGLANGTTYTFRVAAKNAAGTGAQSAPSAGVTPTQTAVAPGAPTGVTGTPGNAQVALSWTAPASSGTQPIDGYIVTPFIGASAQTAITFDSTATTQTIVGLVNGTAYTFRVAAKSAAGIGAASAASAAITPRTVPSPPTGVSAVAGNAQATISWIAPNSNGGSPITGYVVAAFIGATPWGTWNAPAGATSLVITSLINDITYTFRVTATNAAGPSTASSPSNAVTPAGPPVAPGAPTGVTGIAGDGQVTLSWSEPASIGSHPVDGYLVTPYIGAVAQPTRSFNVATSQVITGLANGTTYTFRVAAKNFAGTSPQSAPSAPLTPMVSPAPFATWAAFVNRQYADVVNGTPTTAQRNAWVADLSSGAKTKGELIEALRRGTDNTVAVDPGARLYRAFLQRTPDAGGFRFWVTRRRTGAWTLVRMADHFSQSSEFTRKYGALTNRQFVTRIYTDVLERTPDAAGVDYWTRQLDLRRRNRGSVMVGFSESNEYKRKQAENTDAAVAYIFLLGRSPSAAEVSSWTTRQKAGTSQATLATELLESTAYAARITG